MASKKYVFLSYSHQDKLLVDKLTAALQERGVHIWRDVQEIQAGSNWMQEMEKGLKGASALIYVGSKHSSSSNWMNAEVGAFLNQGKQIIPLITDDAAIESMPMFLSQYQWLNLRHSFDRTIDTIVDALRGEITIGSPIESKAKQSKGYVFLSYAERDADFVEQLKVFMKKNGYAYWDYEESDRDYHSQLFLELEGVIKESSATLCVLSEAWKISKWTLKEYFFSEEVGIPVFLLRAKKIGPTLAIAGIPYIDFVPDMDAGFSKLNRELRRKKL